MDKELTDEECDSFHWLPVTFNDKARAIHKAGYLRGCVETNRNAEKRMQDLINVIKKEAS